MNLFPRTTNFNFVGRRKAFFLFSAVVIAIGLVALAVRGADILSLDFTGGYLTQVEFAGGPVETGQLRQKLLAGGYRDASIQRVGETGGSRFIIRTRAGGAEMVPALRAAFPEHALEVLAEEQISPVMGRTIRRQTIIGFLLALVGILVYISIRFEFRFAVGAILALLHDLLVTLGFLALTGRRLDSIVIAGLLTILGYSVNDTVVVFDRVRENIRGLRKVEEGVETVFNRSINENISRTTITSLTTLFAALCLYFLGGPVLNDFAFVMIIGIIVGTYSSIFVASSLVVTWETKHPHRFKT